MEKDTGTGQNARGGPAGYNMGINIIPPNINKKKGPTGINALYREITRQYMEAFYRALSDNTYFSPRRIAIMKIPCMTSRQQIIVF